MNQSAITKELNQIDDLIDLIYTQRESSPVKAYDNLPKIKQRVLRLYQDNHVNFHCGHWEKLGRVSVRLLQLTKP